ncbi:hypothetical protein [Actinoalloteichus spitiensis]|uniref:hypothetical protein n=1 Tax=Actinoalloteichus spitiensis TaxID=252394 RepID=UPI00036F64C0|nr:hypothetical protein [Actinoalloteichus spitiensis]
MTEDSSARVWIRRHGWWQPPQPFTEDSGWHLWPAGQALSRSPVSVMTAGFEYYVCDGGPSRRRALRRLVRVGSVSPRFVVSSVDDGFDQLGAFFRDQGRTLTVDDWYEDQYTRDKFRSPRNFHLLAWTFEVTRSVTVPLPSTLRFAPSGWLNPERDAVLPAEVR